MTDFLDELKFAVDKVMLHIDDYRTKDNIQICLYLGIKNEDSFEYGFNCENFYNRINEILKDTKWDNSNKDEYTLYTVDDNPLLFIEHHLNEDKIYKKEILHEYTFLYKNTPFDFQVLVFEYTPIKKMPMNINETGKYLLDNYLLRNSCISLYQSELHLEDCIEVEQGLIINTIEMNKTNHSSMYMAHDLLLRLRDIINLCEPITNANLELLSEYKGK